MLYLLTAFQKAEIEDKFIQVYACLADSEESAHQKAIKVLEDISDVYGFSYVEIYDSDNTLIEVVDGNYKA